MHCITFEYKVRQISLNHHDEYLELWKRFYMDLGEFKLTMEAHAWAIDVLLYSLLYIHAHLSSRARSLNFVLDSYAVYHISYFVYLSSRGSG